jgi:hypothetical protein
MLPDASEEKVDLTVQRLHNVAGLENLRGLLNDSMVDHLTK